MRGTIVGKGRGWRIFPLGILWLVVALLGAIACSPSSFPDATPTVTPEPLGRYAWMIRVPTKEIWRVVELETDFVTKLVKVDGATIAEGGAWEDAFFTLGGLPAVIRAQKPPTDKQEAYKLYVDGSLVPLRSARTVVGTVSSIAEVLALVGVGQTVPTPTPTPTPTPVPAPQVTCSFDDRFSVAAGYRRWFDIRLRQGERVSGYFTVEAGSNVNFNIQDGFGNVIREGGRVVGTRSFDFRADVEGTYRLVFSNTYSYFSNKLIHLVYRCSY